MNCTRRPPLQHPLALVFEHAVDSFSTALSPDTTRHYRGTVCNFLEIGQRNIDVAHGHP
jgi:hypothetical protein